MLFLFHLRIASKDLTHLLNLILSNQRIFDDTYLFLQPKGLYQSKLLRLKAGGLQFESSLVYQILIV